MTTKDEALKLALEALDLAKRSHGVMLLSDPLQEAWKAYRVDDTLRNAITAIREALAEQQSGIKQVIELYDSPEQPACKYPNCPYPCPDLPDCRDAEHPAQQQEPVVTRFPMKLTCTRCGAVDEGFLDVESEAPPASKPLTDEEIKRMAAPLFMSHYWNLCNEFARAIEAAHGIKGGA